MKVRTMRGRAANLASTIIPKTVITTVLATRIAIFTYAYLSGLTDTMEEN